MLVGLDEIGRGAVKFLIAALAALSFLVPAQAQEEKRGGAIVPESSLESPFDIGVRAHTNHQIRIHPDAGSGLGGTMTPGNLRSFYGMPSTGGGGVIAVVVAYHYSTALSDFNKFSGLFGLPQETGSGSVFQVMYQGGKKPRPNNGWAQEAALDIEWSHAMSPGAQIVLVEAQSNSFANLLAAVDLASSIPGVRQISMSWGASEFSGEASYDSHFPSNGIVYFASSGDTGGVINWPSVSKFVVSVGGTSVDASGDILKGETGWSGSGGGDSTIVSRPSWQTTTVGTGRSVPDISADADPNTGVLVVWNGGYYQFGGTSVSSPCMAGMANVSGVVNTSTTSFLTTLYSQFAVSPTAFRDITSGTAGKFSCKAGWDFVTGVGSPLSTASLKP
jgi:subtilase family serine protease